MASFVRQFLAANAVAVCGHNLNVKKKQTSLGALWFYLMAHHATRWLQP
jgi:hypothetical protein